MLWLRGFLSSGLLLRGAIVSGALVISNLVVVVFVGPENHNTE
jgi:hypothetical protein